MFSNVHTAVEKHTPIGYKHIVCPYSIFIVVAMDVTAALFTADCLNVFYWEQRVYFFVYWTKRYLSRLRNPKAGWIDRVDLDSGQRQYQNSEWHLQLLIVKSRCQRCEKEEASFKKSFTTVVPIAEVAFLQSSSSPWAVIDEGVVNRWRMRPLACRA